MERSRKQKADGKGDCGKRRESIAGSRKGDNKTASVETPSLPDPQASTGPSQAAIAAAKEIQKNWSKLQEQGTQHAYWLNSGDPFGPCLSDWRDGDELVTRGLAAIIEKHMGKP